MVNIPKLKINFEYEKKKKEKPIKIPKAHTLNLGRVRSIVLLILIGLFIYFSYVLVLANATAHKNKRLQQTVATLNHRINQENAGTISYNPLVDQYIYEGFKLLAQEYDAINIEDQGVMHKGQRKWSENKEDKLRKRLANQLYKHLSQIEDTSINDIDQQMSKLLSSVKKSDKGSNHRKKLKLHLAQP